MASHAARPGPALHPRPGGMFTATATLPSALPPFPPARPPFHGVRGCSSRFAASKWRHSTGDRGHDGCPAAVPLDQDGLRRPLRPNPSSGHAQSDPSPAGRPPWASRLGRYVSPRSFPSPAQLSIGLR